MISNETNSGDIGLTFIDAPEVTRDAFTKMADDDLQVRESTKAELKFPDSIINMTCTHSNTPLAQSPATWLDNETAN